MELNHVGVVLFDLDGTLIDTMRLYMECYRVAAQPYVRADLTDAEIKSYRPRSEVRFLRFLVAPEDFDACLADFYAAYEAGHDAFFDGVYDGVPDLLAGLRYTGTQVGIVTGKSRRSWEITSARVDLGPFDVLVLDDDVSQPKPHPGGLLHAMDLLAADPSETIYVGDTSGDLKAAKGAGVQGVAALWASRREPDRRRRFTERARRLGALVVRTPAELARRLGVED
ncbi:MAG: HAD family hydrolase [Gemmatimonadota bacterium]|jgi:pyrophosphatase PpaX